MIKKYLKVILFSIAAFLSMGTAVFAAFTATIQVTNNSTTAYPMVGLNISSNIEFMADNGFFDGVEGLDTRVTLGTDEQPHLLATDRITFAIPVPALSNRTLYFTTGSSNLSSFAIVPGNGGYITTPDAVNLEPGGNFTYTCTGCYFDSTVSGNITDKPGAFRIAGDGSGNITAQIGEIPGLGSFTEVDAPNKITISGTRVTAADVDRDESIYLYYDFGASYFDDIDVEWETYADSTSQADGLFAVGFANAVGDISSFGTTGIASGINTLSSFFLYRGNAAAGDTMAWGGGMGYDTPYYITLTRPAGGDTVTVKIYTDAARTALLDTLTVAGFGVTKYRYFYAAVGRNTAQANKNYDGYIQNISIATRSSISVSGVASGEQDIEVGLDSPFFSIDINNHYPLPTAAYLQMNAPLWQANLSSDNFTTIDSNAYTINSTGTTWSNIGRVFDGASYLKHTEANWRSTDTQGSIAIWFTAAVQTKMLFVSSDEGTSTSYFKIYMEGANDLVYLESRNAAGVNRRVFLTGELIDYVNPNLFVVTSDGTTWEASLNNSPLTTMDVSAGANTGDWLGDITLRDNFTIGAWEHTVVSQYLTGTIGEVAYWSFPLTETEKTEYYNATKWKYDGDTDRYMKSVVVSVPSNTENWTHFTNNVIPYATSINMSVNGITQLHYEPNEIITSINATDGFTGTLIAGNMTDRSAGVNNWGRIIWGGNPTGVNVALGALVSDYSVGEQDSTGTLDVVPDITAPNNPSDVARLANLAANDPLFYPLFSAFSIVMGGMSILAMYWMWFFIFALILFFVIYKYTNNLLFSGLGFSIVIGFATAWPTGGAIYDPWVIILIAIFLGGMALLEGRQAA